MQSEREIRLLVEERKTQRGLEIVSIHEQLHGQRQSVVSM